jgi:hypothetical protein
MLEMAAEAELANNKAPVIRRAVRAMTWPPWREKTNLGPRAGGS